VPKLNPAVESVTELGQAQNGAKVALTKAVLPWPLAKRISYLARYEVKLAEGFMFLLSERGAESFINQ
jgi:hypothetical protein